MSAARNDGIRASKGKFIQFLDSDDLIEFEKLQKQSEILCKNQNIDLVYSDAWYFSSDDLNVKYKTFQKTDTEWMPKLSGKNEVVLKHLLKGNIMPCSCPLFRKSCVEKVGYLNETLFNHEDYEFWSRFALAGLYFQYNDQINTGALIRLHGQSMSKSTKMELGFSLVQLKLFIDIQQLHFDIPINKKMVKNEKKKLTKLFLSKEITSKHLLLVLNISERIRFYFLGLVPQKYQYKFLMFDFSDLRNLF